MQTQTCGTCGTARPDVRVRDYGYATCDTCHADALAYGHMHGLHTDDDGEPITVEGCPSCAGHTPAAYKL
jgi:hypothetical protein